MYVTRITKVLLHGSLFCSSTRYNLQRSALKHVVAITQLYDRNIFSKILTMLSSMHVIYSNVFLQSTTNDITKTATKKLGFITVL